MKFDYINALFEFGSACLLLLNVIRLHKDKRLKGVSVIPTAWFSLWGAWNLYYYPSLGQTWSWAAGIAVFTCNTTWVLMALYYKIDAWIDDA